MWRAHPCAFCGGRGLGGSRAGAGVGGQPPGPRHPLCPVLLSDCGAVSWAPRGWLCRHALPRAFPLPSAVGSRQRCDGDTAPVAFSCFSSLTTRAALCPCLRPAAHTPQQPWRTAGPPTQDSRGSVSSSVCQVGDEGSRTVGPRGLGPQFRLAVGSQDGNQGQDGLPQLPPQGPRGGREQGLHARRADPAPHVAGSPRALCTLLSAICGHPIGASLSSPLYRGQGDFPWASELSRDRAGPAGLSVPPHSGWPPLQDRGAARSLRDLRAICQS